MRGLNVMPDDLLNAAVKARENAYVPYSGFKVGAALLTAAGKIYTGCNIENAAFGPGNCAERTAFFKAVSEGEREFAAIAVAGWPDGQRTPNNQAPVDGTVSPDGSSADAPESYAYPCGVCRQVMMEFCSQDFRVLVAGVSSGGINGHKAFTLKELLPWGFGPQNLK